MAAVLILLLAGCVPGQLHPAPSPLVGVGMGQDGNPIAVMRLCANQRAISLWVETEDRRIRWEVERDDGAPRPTELPLLSVPEGWHLEQSTLDSVQAQENYVLVLAALFGPDIQPVKFRLEDLEALDEDYVWSHDPDAGEREARAMAIADFEERAEDECRAADQRR